MNTKAEVGPIGAMMLFMVFIVMWFIWLGKWVGDVGQYAVSQNNLVGIEAFAFNNLNGVVFIGLILGIMAWGYFAQAQ